MTAQILVENVTKTYRRGRVRALDGVTLRVGAGTVLGVIGPNGAGKSTLMGCLLGLLRPDSGRVSIGGDPPDALRARAATGYLPERLVFDRWMLGRDFLAYQHALAGGTRDDRASAVAAALSRAGLSPEEAARPLKTYSRGMLQRLGLAQSLIGSPTYLLLDEPTSGMDPTGVVALRSVVDEMRSAGGIVVINSHQLDQVERLCDTIAFLRSGLLSEISAAGGDLTRRTLRLRFASPDVSREQLAVVAEAVGARLIDGHSRGEARFVAESDDGAAALIEALVAAGLRVCEASREESRLESLFTGGRELREEVSR